MATSVSVYFERERLPAATTWQLAIREAGFALELDTTLDLTTLRGVVPAQYAGEPTGFEYFLDMDTEMPHDRSTVEEGRTLDTCVSLVSRSPVETIAAVAAAAVLTQITSGVLYDDAEDRAHEQHDAIGWARQIIAESEEP